MSTIITRIGKGSPLTNVEVDTNFTNLNTDKLEAATTATLTNKTISADNNTLSGIAASSFVLSNASGNIDGSAAQKAIPTGVVVGTTDTQTLTNKTLSTGTAVTAGTINNTSIGATTASTGAFTTLAASGTTTLSGNQIISVTDNSNAALRITQLGTGNALLVEDSANPDSTPFVIDGSGRVSVGTTEVGALTPAYNGTQTNTFAIAGITQGPSSSVIANWGNTTTPTNLVFSKSRGGVIGTHAVVSSTTELGKLNFEGSDGTAFIQAASILAAVDGTPGTNDMPGRLVFSTTADGAASPTERMRIDSAGNVAVSGTITENAFPVVTQTDVGTAPNQIPLNQYLGDLAYQDAANIAGNVGVGGNLAFTGTGNRITGDFSNATVANRAAFQTNSGNNTVVGVLANNTTGLAGFIGYASNDPANTSTLDLLVRTDAQQAVQIRSSITGTGTYLPMTFQTGGSESMRLSATSKALILAGGDTAANGTGITFPGTQDASSNANTLDDYEEGTWTPVPTFGGGNTGMVYLSLGAYTKIGRLVHLRGEFAISSNGSSTGTVRFGGLPFTPNASQFIGGMIGDGFTFTGAQLNAVLEVGRTDITAVIQAGGTGSLGGWTYMQNTAISNGSKYFELVYYV